MSYGFHRLPRKATAEDYIVAVANQMSVVVAIGVEIQGNEGIGYTPNIPGDDQSMPQMSTNALVDDTGVNDTFSVDVRSQGYTGDVCQHCQGSRMRWAGHCQVCEDCGESSGCS